MAQFNIDAHLSNGKQLEWLALPDAGEKLDEVVERVRLAAMQKFGPRVLVARWSRTVASNGYVSVQMHG